MSSLIKSFYNSFLFQKFNKKNIKYTTDFMRAKGDIYSLKDMLFGVDKEKLNNINHDILLMHPGPINRGVEIDSSIADGEQTIILDQVLNGVAIRMSILYLLLASDDEESKWHMK